MYWTLEMASKLEDAPWPATKAELIDYAQLEDEGIAYDGIEEIWPDYPTKEDFFFHEDEY